MTNLNNKYFISASSTDNGEVSSETKFHYRQKEEVIWATYEGGDILFGTLSGYRKGDQLEFRYQHQNKEGIFKFGKCSTIVIAKDDGIELHETWEWMCDDFSKGTSVLKETLR